jgi:tRNA-Thr(GGU) m(6)t(6)A37 methyltransferase TsaA
MMVPDGDQKDRSVQVGDTGEGRQECAVLCDWGDAFDAQVARQSAQQGAEGAPDAWLDVSSFAVQGLDGLLVGHDIIVVTWLHCARRDVLEVHPRSDLRRPLTGVFATRSPDRPNPLGLHRVTVRRVVKNRLRIGPIEAIDGTPVIDIKPVLSGLPDY